MSPSKPRLTARVVRGLRTISAAISSAPDEVLIGIEEAHFDEEEKSAFSDAMSAVEWIDALAARHDAKTPEERAR